MQTNYIAFVLMITFLPDLCDTWKGSMNGMWQ